MAKNKTKKILIYRIKYIYRFISLSQLQTKLRNQPYDKNQES